MRLPNWLRWKNRKTVDEILSIIDDHREEARKAGIVIDKIIAALDGEDHWWDCSCIEKWPFKERRKEKGKDHAFDDYKRHKLGA